MESETAIKIDGLLNESMWSEAIEIVLVDNKTGLVPEDSNLLTFVKAGYDDQYLYIAFVCNDMDIWSTFTERDQHLWKEEAVEVFIDTDSIVNTYVEIEVSPRNIWFDSYIVDSLDIDVKATAQFNLTDFRCAVDVKGTLDNRNDTDIKWVVEMAVSFLDLSIKSDGGYMQGKKWRINFYRINRDGNGGPTDLAWSPTGGRFHRPSVFGYLIFE
jgi:hypothetical protein